MNTTAPSTVTPVPRRTADIRNVVLVGPAGSGKSTLYDHLVSTLAAGYRPAPDDTDRSARLTAAAVPLGDLTLNLLDAPGYRDFVGELRAGLRAADAAIFVIAATDGIDAATTALWRECAQIALPRAVVITKLDAPQADFALALSQIQAAFDDGVRPLGIPEIHDGQLQRIIDLVLGEVHDYTGAQRTVQPTDEAHIPVFDKYQGPLLETIIQESEDETLMDRYLSGEQLGFDVIEPGLLKAIATARFHPVIPVSTTTDAGLDVLLHLVESGFPAPGAARDLTAYTVAGADVALSADPDGPLVAQVIQTTTDEYVGQIALLRVFSGTLRPDSLVQVTAMPSDDGDDDSPHRASSEDARIAALGSPFGHETRSKSAAIAGDLVTVARLTQVRTSDTVTGRDKPIVVVPWQMPAALLPTAIAPASRNDEGRLPDALKRLRAGDLSLRVEHNTQTGQTVLWTMGQMHLDQVMRQLQNRMRVEVTTEPLRVALRETFLSAAEGQGRHIKQSGGHGQYAVCQITVEPLPRGGGFEFVDKVVGGAVPRQFIPSVEKGVRDQMQRGVVAGYPMVDLRVTLHDGKAHSVDSSDAAFQAAGALALREAAAAAQTALLEPIDTLVVTVADDYVGAVMSDLSSRRARILGTDADEQPGHTSVSAEVPQTELTTYALDLLSFSHGSGTFTRELHGYEVVPPGREGR